MTAEFLFPSCLILQMREQRLRGEGPIQGGRATGSVGRRVQTIFDVPKYCQSLSMEAERQFFSVNCSACDIPAFADSMKSG